MPDTINKQSLINLLIDSPLREPIKINLIDIVNNTSEPDLPKVFTTITKELEIFQKATERRMKLADETIAKLSGTATGDPTTTPPTPTDTPTPAPSMPTPPPVPAPAAPPVSVPPLDLPQHIESDSSREMTPGAQQPGSPLPPAPPSPTDAPTPPPLSVPPLDLPPLPTSQPAAPASPEPLPPPQPLGAPVTTSSSDEDALAEIQKELDSLKSEAANGVAADATPATPAAPVASPQA